MNRRAGAVLERPWFFRRIECRARRMTIAAPPSGLTFQQHP
jgi:hypothetical protein